MLILIYGDDTFRAAEKLQEMKVAFKQKFDPTGMNLEEFPTEDSPKINPAEVWQSACSYPFLGEKRMVIVRDVIGNTNKDQQDVWVEGVARLPESTILIFWESTSPKQLERKSLFKECQKTADVFAYSYPKLQGKALADWVSQRIRQKKGLIDVTACSELVQRVGPDLWQMNGEIEKLIAYASGQRITLEMVERLVRPSFEGQIFAFIDAVCRKSSKEALKLLEQERAAGANDFYLFTMLSRQIRILLGVRALLEENPYADKQVVAHDLDLHPFVASKAIVQAKAFSLKELKDVHSLLFEYEGFVKRGKMDIDVAVDTTTANLLQKK